MRIVCPACSAAYQVPDGRLAAGRVVRCARCDTDWVPLPDAPAAPIEAPSPVPEPIQPVIEQARAPEPAPEIDASNRDATLNRRPRWALRLAWIASVALVLAGLVGLVTMRDAVMREWPPSIRAYAALGLAGHDPGHDSDHDLGHDSGHESRPDAVPKLP